jgi:hypothetical protein
VFSVSELEMKLEFLLPVRLIQEQTPGRDPKVSLYLKEKLFVFREDGWTTIIDYKAKKISTQNQYHNELPRNIYLDKLSRLYFFLYNMSVHVVNADDFTFISKINGDFKKIDLREGVNIACLTTSYNIEIYSYKDFEYPTILNHGNSNVTDIKYSSNELFLTGRTENPVSVLIWTSENVDHLLTFNENKQFKDFIAFGSSNSKMNNFILCFDEDYYKVFPTIVKKFRFGILIMRLCELSRISRGTGSWI